MDALFHRLDILTAEADVAATVAIEIVEVAVVAAVVELLVARTDLRSVGDRVRLTVEIEGDQRVDGVLELDARLHHVLTGIEGVGTAQRERLIGRTLDVEIALENERVGVGRVAAAEERAHRRGIGATEPQRKRALVRLPLHHHLHRLFPVHVVEEAVRNDACAGGIDNNAHEIVLVHDGVGRDPLLGER